MATIEIDGKQFEVESGKSIIEVADENGIDIPRFCYHKKLSVAANCRMCLVEVEKSRKPLPACATPITDGMKVFTKSKLATDAQKAVMEFLLINHPLDCPVCDQGGECELQDVSLGYGRGYSEYDEPKRAVDSDNLGPLVATDMTRCIHCTRCVRFGEEVAGMRELGGTGRGENTHIGTFVQHSMRSEVSGNIIDLCPVGALTSKPFRFKARPWELTQHATIAPHDCLGSNIEMHVRRNEALRVVPKENDNINETWLSDRDRFSYLGLNSETRLTVPMIKVDGRWEETSWETALKAAAHSLQETIKTQGPEQWASFVSPSSTLEEMFLLQKLMRSHGVHNIDHRIQQSDFADQEHAPLAPIMSCAYSDIENQKVIFLIGSNLRYEQPLANLRVRKAFRDNAKILALNPVDYELNYDLSAKIITAPQNIPQQLAQIVAALAEHAQHPIPEAAGKLLADVNVSKEAKHIAEMLRDGSQTMIILGAIAQNHPQAAVIRSLVLLLELLTQAKIVQFTTGANAAGAWMSGCVPHRGPIGKGNTTPGLDIQTALKQKLRGYLFLGLEPEFDISNPHQTMQALKDADSVIMLTAFKTPTMLEYATILLPIAPYAETSGTYINMAGIWQTVKGVVPPRGQARPAWKVLRVLGNLTNCRDFEYQSSEEVLNQFQKLYAEREMNSLPWYLPKQLNKPAAGLTRIGDWPIYRIDSLSRHANALQHAAVSFKEAVAYIHPATVEKYRLSHAVTISQNNNEITMPLRIDTKIAEDAIFIASALPQTMGLGAAYEEIQVRNADKV